ncbi:MAG: LPS assembly lipoprotein LptE [Pseudomonadota bacterium]
MRRALFALCALMPLIAACGFEPLYAERGPRGGVVHALSGVTVAPIPDRVGQLVHNRLTTGLTPSGSADDVTHRLEIELDSSIEGFGFRADEAITRERIRLVAHYRLIDAASSDVVFEDVVRADTSIDLVQSDYAIIIAEEKASARNAEQVADLILSRLALYFRAHDKSGAMAR